jgi:hypothetical protein
VARIAGNLLSGYNGFYTIEPTDHAPIVRAAAQMARAIVEETIRTEPSALPVREPDNSEYR